MKSPECIKLKKFFPEVDELLISHREGRLAPQRVKVIGDLVLWEGPLGTTVGGAHPDTLCLLHEDSSCQISRNKKSNN